VTPHDLITLTECLDEATISLIEKKLVGKKPNTYTYTKSQAEKLVIDEMSDIPCAIVRPSMIMASWREPFPGWIDCFNGPFATYPGLASGLMRISYGISSSICDLIPVDIVS
jgi:alcohol-forming fatty acyl-CoA reductase